MKKIKERINLLLKNWEKKKIIKIIIALLIIFVICLTLTLIFNKSLRTIVGQRIQEIFKSSEIETKIEYEIQPLERRKLKCILTN